MIFLKLFEALVHFFDLYVIPPDVVDQNTGKYRELVSRLVPIISDHVLSKLKLCSIQHSLHGTSAYVLLRRPCRIV